MPLVWGDIYVTKETGYQADTPRRVAGTDGRCPFFKLKTDPSFIFLVIGSIVALIYILYLLPLRELRRPTFTFLLF